jgi:hypothetical protein
MYRYLPGIKAARRAVARRTIDHMRLLFEPPAPQPLGRDSWDLNEGACTCHGGGQCATCRKWRQRLAKVRRR